MEVSSRKKTNSSGYRYPKESRENDFEFDINDISRASTPTSTFSSKSEGRKKEREHRYSADDYKRKIARLKSELDMEKAKNKKVHKEKASEIRDLRESYEIRKRTEMEETEKKLRAQQEEEIKRKEEELRIIKDKEVQQVLKYKEDELKEMRHRHKKERESAIKLAIENEKKVIEEKERRLIEEMDKLKKEKEKMEVDYKKKCSEESRKEKEFAKLKEEYDAELRRILGESKKLALGNLEKLKKAEKALSECNEDSEDELTGVDFSELLADLQSQTSSRVVSRSVSTTSELKMEPINLDNLLASPAVTPAPDADSRDHVSPSPFSREPHLKSRSSSAMSEPARDLFNRKLEDKDRQLQRRVSELQTQTQRLERKITLLKTENDTLKRKQDDKRPLEEKIKTLKKRNAELAAIARRLEEKAKHLQQENLKKTKEMTGQQQAQGQHSTETMKKMFARQRAKDLAEHAKNMLSKDREIEDLRKKCQELADQLSNADFLGPENSEMYEEKEELVSIMKLAAKERLQLERQLAIAKPGPECKIVDAEKYKELLETNEALKKEITKLEKVRNETERLEIELTQKKLECERLSSDINTEKSRSKALEAELEESASKNTHLTVQVSDLQQRLAELEKVNEECSTLRLSLSDAQHECEVAKGEVSALHVKVQNLETVVKNLEFSTEKLKQVERDYHETVLKLQDKQREIDTLQKIQDSAREKYEQAIKSLQEKIIGLESQCHQQALQQEKLTQELTQLRAQAAKRASRETISCEIQTGKSIEFNPSATSSPNSSPRISPANHHSARKSPATPHSPSLIQPQFIAKTLTPLKSASPVTAKGHNSYDTRTPNHELIQPQHNNISHTVPKKPTGPGLATVHRTESTKSGTDTGFVDDDSEVNHSEERSHDQSPDPEKAAFEDPELYEIHKKLKELEAEASDISEGDLSKTGDKGEDSGMESRGDHRGDMKEVSEISLGESRLSALAKEGPIQVYVAKYSYDPYQYSPNENPEAELPLRSGDYVLIYGDMDEDGFFDGELINGQRGLVPSNFIEKVADEDLPDFHAALATLGHHDDDSTTVNSMQHDLDFDSSEELEKHEELAAVEENSPIKPEPTSDLEDIVEEDEDHDHRRRKPSVTDDTVSSGAPFPKNLQLDRQLSNSIFVSWRPPDNVSPTDIRSYHVFLDGDFKTTVRGTERTKALLENVESRKVHRVSVRCVSVLGQSHDNQCTILVGKDVQHKPFDLRVYDITANSATVSWCPGNSNYHHALLVDSLEVRVLPPGSFTYTLTGLVPAKSHKVTIEARKLTGKGEEGLKPEQLSATTEFMTAAGGIPEPPINVQVESGPQEGTLLLTWLPVTIDTSGFSNGAIVTGYMVYADGQPVKEAKGATNDHIVLSSDDFQGFIPKQLTVRTVTKDKKESTDFEVVKLPQNLIQEITAGAARKISTEASKKEGLRKSPLHGRDPDEELESAFREIPGHQTAVLTNGYQDAYIDSSCSELSDIPEVEEETSSSPEPANENIHSKVSKPPLVNGLSTDSSDFEEIFLPEEIKPSGKPSADGKSMKPPSKSPRRSSGMSGERTKSPVLPNQNKEDIGVIQKITSPILTDQIKDSNGITQRVKSPVMRSKEDSLNRDRKAVSPELAKQAKDSMREIKRVKSEDKDKTGVNQTEPLGASDSRRAVPAIEITRESSNEITNSVDVPDSDHEIIKTDMSESATSKVSSRQNNEQQQKYSASMDKRDGYRENGPGQANSKSQKQKSKSCDISESVNNKQRGVSSPRENSSPRGISPRENSSSRKVSPRNSQSPVRGRSPMGQRQKGLESPRDLQSPRKTSPRERSDEHGLSRSQSGDRIRSGGVRNSPQRSSSAGKSPRTSPLTNKDSNANNLSPTNVLKPRTLLPNEDFGEGSDADSISGEINPPLDDNRIRLFVALFDYDPETMSPNIDALDEELPFREGQVIKVYGDKDADGFYRGESGGRIGFIPCNMVSEIQVDDPELEEQLLKEVHECSNMPQPGHMASSEKYMKPITSNGLSPGVTHMTGEVPVRRMVAVYDYDPQELSPNVDAEVELSFKVGDIIIVFGEMDDDGFYMGELNGQRGLVPSNFLQEAGTGLSDDEAMESVSVITPARSGESIHTPDSRKSLSSDKADKQQSPNKDGSPSKLANTQLDRVETRTEEINMQRPRSLTPEEIKQKKKSGGFLSKGKNILKKLTR